MDKINGSVDPCFTGLSIRFSPYGFCFPDWCIAVLPILSPNAGTARRNGRIRPPHARNAPLAQHVRRHRVPQWRVRTSRSGGKVAPCRMVTTACSHVAAEGDHAVRGRDDGFLRSASRSTPRWPGSHCCFGASYLPTTCAPFSGHRIRTAQEPDAVAAFVFAYVGSADHRQHTSSMTHARAHTTMVWRNCWRMRFFSSCAILFRRIRLRYSRSSMMAPSRCCVCAVALCCGKSPA